MEEKILYSMESPFQQEINVKGYYFGKNEGKERSACIVGALRGNEFGKRFWISDDTDLNRLFPGNPSGESGSRVAYAIMETTRGYRYGIHLPSFYLGGTFMPHIRLLDP